jgi:hypothetical protein
MDVWLAPRDIPIGSNYAIEISRAISRANFMIVLLSPDAIASPHVKREVNLAVDRGITLLPVQLNKTSDFMQNLPEDWKYWLSLVQIVTFTNERFTALQIEQQVSEKIRYKGQDSVHLQDQETQRVGRIEQKLVETPKLGPGGFSSKEKTHPFRPTNTMARLSPVAKILTAVIVIGIVFSAGTFLKGNKGEPNTSRTQKALNYSWSALVSGETRVQTGPGRSFNVFVCDQNVNASSLRLSAQSIRGAGAGPLRVISIANDSKCGVGFDSIIATGTESTVPGTVNYLLTGSTESAYKFQYDFVVTTNGK